MEAILITNPSDELLYEIANNYNEKETNITVVKYIDLYFFKIVYNQYSS